MAFLKYGLIYVLATLFSDGVQSSSPRIVGGENACIQEVPFMASLQQKFRFSLNHICGAVIVTTKFLLTAAHCVCATPDNDNEECKMRDPKKYIIMCGSRFVAGGYRSNVLDFFKHPEYNHITSEYDWGAIRLQKDLDFFLSHMTPAPLPARDYVESSKSLEGILNAKEKCRVYGWGVTSPRSSSILRVVELQVLPSDECTDLVTSMLGGVFHGSNQICTLEEELMKDACLGDSGGPLVCQNVVWGLVSWGSGCARNGVPGIYSRADVARNWLEKVMESSESRAGWNTLSHGSWHWAFAFFLITSVI